MHNHTHICAFIFHVINESIVLIKTKDIKKDILLKQSMYFSVYKFDFLVRIARSDTQRECFLKTIPLQFICVSSSQELARECLGTERHLAFGFMKKSSYSDLIFLILTSSPWNMISISKQLLIAEIVDYKENVVNELLTNL